MGVGLAGHVIVGGQVAAGGQVAFAVVSTVSSLLVLSIYHKTILQIIEFVFIILHVVGWLVVYVVGIVIIILV